MTDEQLQEWQAATDAATPGPWRGDRHDGTVKYHVYGANDAVVLQVDHKNGESGFLGDNGDNDEAFVLAARTAMPALLAEATKVRRGHALYCATVTVYDQPLTFAEWLDMLTGENGEARP